MTCRECVHYRAFKNENGVWYQLPVDGRSIKSSETIWRCQYGLEDLFMSKGTCSYYMEDREFRELGFILAEAKRKAEYYKEFLSQEEMTI